MIYIVSAILIIICFLAIKYIKSIPITPDPWDNIIDKNELEDAMPVCTKCFKTVENKNQHYCLECGNITGEYTRYIPFVNIAFNYSIFEDLWKNFSGKDKGFFNRGFSFILILLLAPIMLVFGLPILLYSRFKKKIKKL